MGIEYFLTEIAEAVSLREETFQP